MMATTSVEVDVQELIDWISNKITQVNLDHEEAEIQYKADKRVYDLVFSALVAAVCKKSNQGNAEIESHYVYNVGYRQGVWLPVPDDVEIPEAPSKPPKPDKEVRSMERDISMLRRHTKPTIRVSATSDLSKYL